MYYNQCRTVMLTKLSQSVLSFIKLMNICDPLRENCPFAKNFQNVVGATKVALAKKLIPNLKKICQEMESPFLCLHFEPI